MIFKKCNLENKCTYMQLWSCWRYICLKNSYHITWRLFEVQSSFGVKSLCLLLLFIAKHSYLYQVVPWFDQYPRWFSGKESTCQCRKARRRGFSPWVRKILWRRKWLPTPVFLPGKLHGQRGLVGYNSCGHKEPERTEHSCTTIVSTVVDGMK